MKITNPVYLDLKRLGLVKDKDIVILSNRTRDANIKVLKDEKQNLIFLSEHKTGNKYYSNAKSHDLRSIKIKSKMNNNYIYTKKGNIITKYLDDNVRRKAKYNKYLIGKDILDFGCGWGNFLQNLRGVKSKNAVEVGKNFIKFLKTKKQIIVKEKISDFRKNFDYITLFHVLHYLPNQIEILKNLKKKLKKRGKIIIEVPNAKDFLLSFDEFKDFKNFTFSKEQLILHTERSLKIFLKKAGFKKIKVEFYQRYNFCNHLGWFLFRKPGGHSIFNDFFDIKLNKAYIEFLKKKKMTDTLILIAEN